MFESAELGHTLNTEAFKALEKRLRPALLNAQFGLLQSEAFSLLIVINGPDYSGKLALAHRICEWTDVHYLQTLAFPKPTATERKRPKLLRYWQALPKRGRIGLVLGSWYNQPIGDFVNGAISQETFINDLNQLREFEHLLTAERVHVLKLWLELSDKELSARRKKAIKTDRPVSALEEWESMEHLKPAKLQALGELVISRTSTNWSPWHLVAADDAHYRDAYTCKLLLDTLRQPGTSLPPANAGPRRINPPALDGKTRLNTLDLSHRIDKPQYHEQLTHWQTTLTDLVNSGALTKKSAVLVFEGCDAAGKGGCIRRITQALDPRQFRVHSIAAPSAEEQLRPYLWRFWQRLPSCNQLAILDRSYYGRVLVERIEGLIPEPDWQRAYGEIRSFEKQLAAAGILVIKFWLQISPEEQLKRFQDREAQPHKRHKLTKEDWRNRERWDDYQAAACEMFDRTSTENAPWHIIAAEHKRFARIEVLKTLAERIS